MKRSWKILMVLVFITACQSGAVLDRSLTDTAFVNVPLETMPQYPLMYEGDLYLLGGLIVDSRQTEKGLILEALYIPVNRHGYIKEQSLAQGTYLALLPLNGPGIDELTYRAGIYFSAAAEFTGLERGIKSSEKLPSFIVKDIHVWGDKYPRAMRTTPEIRDDATESLTIEDAPFGGNPFLP